MKKIIHKILLIAGLLPFSAEAQFYNGNLESGTLGGWRAYTGSNSGGSLNLTTFVEGVVPTRHTIVTPGNDPLVGTPINRVFPPMTGPDSFSVRLGNSSTGTQAEILSFLVSNYYQPSLMGFSMAFVGNQAHGGSTVNENPFISIWVSRSNNLATSMDPGLLLADTTIYLDSLNSFFRPLGTGKIVYREWTRFELEQLFPALAGPWSEQMFTIYLATADCSASGHYGYAYIDNVSRNSKTIADFTTAPTFSSASGGPVIINGAASVAESIYTFRIAKCSPTGAPMSSDYYTTTFSGFVPAGQNIRPFLMSATPPGFFVPGQHYKLTLMTQNTGDASQNEMSRIIKCM